MCVRVHMPAFLYVHPVHAGACGDQKKVSVRSPGAGVVGGWEPPDIGAGNWTWVLSKSGQ